VTAERCGGCGAAIAGGTAGCRALYDEVLARNYSQPAHSACHKLVVDAYSLQHPDEFCRSAKSLATHLTGLAISVEGGSKDRAGAALRRWLDEPVSLAKPSLPEERGRTTLSHLALTAGPDEWHAAVRAWAGDVWAAYTPLHPLACEWRPAAERH